MPAIVVKNQTELDAAVKAAKGGETILLAAGTYSSITLTGMNPTSGITIQSQDSKNPAVVGSIWLTSANNITLKDLSVVRTTTPTDDMATANRILTSSNVTLDNVRFSGGTGDPSNAKGVGLAIRGGTNNKVINSSIDHFVIGMDVRGVDGMLVQGNNFHDNRRDHSNYSEMNNVVIDSNTYTALYPINDEHPDAIQFMTSGRTRANTNITISNNVVMQGDGRGTQGFFMGEENGNLPYENVTIKNNLIYLSGMYHGINLIHGNNVTIDSNTIISAADEKSTWIRVQNVTGSITNNVTDQILTAGTNTLVTNHNVELINDPVTMRGIADLNKGSKATLAGLLVKGNGYAPPAGSRAAALVAAQQQAAAAQTSTAPKLLLDLNFGTGSVLDSSGWSTDDPVKALAAGAISNGMLQVKTGSGLELGRGTSRQLYGLTAFTLSFDMKRDGATATAGQIIGIYKSWNITLRGDGELAFSMTNAAGKTYTMVTSGANIRDASTHKIALTYDSARGTASLYVDGISRGTAAMSGSTRKQESWGLYVGNPFTTAFSGAVGDIEMRDSALSAAQILALNTSSAQTSPAAAADTVKTMVAKSVADSAAALAATTAWSNAMSSPATLSLVGTIGTAAASQSPLAAMLANVSGTGTLSTSTGTLSTLSLTRVAASDLYHA